MKEDQQGKMRANEWKRDMGEGGGKQTSMGHVYTNIVLKLIVVYLCWLLLLIPTVAFVLA